MNYELNLENKLNFENSQLTAPDTIISELGKQVEKETKGFVKGVVKTYDGPIHSYDQQSSIAAIAAALATTQYQTIQQELGAVDCEMFRFEFFLTSPKLESYKYRILFFEFGIANYPVKIVLEQGIADEIFGTEHADYELEYTTKEELTNVILNVLNSKKVIKVMQDLIYAAQRIPPAHQTSEDQT
jgi:hypothetical protein